MATREDWRVVRHGEEGSKGTQLEQDAGRREWVATREDWRVMRNGEEWTKGVQLGEEACDVAAMGGGGSAARERDAGDEQGPSEALLQDAGSLEDVRTENRGRDSSAAAGGGQVQGGRGSRMAVEADSLKTLAAGASLSGERDQVSIGKPMGAATKRAGPGTPSSYAPSSDFSLATTRTAESEGQGDQGLLGGRDGSRRKSEPVPGTAASVRENGGQGARGEGCAVESDWLDQNARDAAAAVFASWDRPLQQKFFTPEGARRDEGAGDAAGLGAWAEDEHETAIEVFTTEECQSLPRGLPQRAATAVEDGRETVGMEDAGDWGETASVVSGVTESSSVRFFVCQSSVSVCVCVFV